MLYKNQPKIITKIFEFAFLYLLTELGFLLLFSQAKISISSWLAHLFRPIRETLTVLKEHVIVTDSKDPQARSHSNIFLLVITGRFFAYNYRKKRKYFFKTLNTIRLTEDKGRAILSEFQYNNNWN